MESEPRSAAAETRAIRISRRRFLALAGGAGGLLGAQVAGLIPGLQGRGRGAVDLNLPNLWERFLPSPAEAAIDSRLELRIESYVGDLRRRGRIASNEETAWSVYDFTSGRKLVSINEDRPHQAASMIKPFVALAFFYRNRENPRRYPYDASMRRKMQMMIQHSSNWATNEIMDEVSGKSGSASARAVERVLKGHASGVFQQTTIVERIPGDGRSYRNLASAHDYSRFLYALWEGQFPGAGEIKRLMALPNGDRIYSRARQVPVGTEIYDKTGTTAMLCGNMGVLVAKSRKGGSFPYTLIGIIEKARRASRFSSWIGSRGDVIREVSNLTYQHLKSVHGLR